MAECARHPASAIGRLCPPAVMGCCHRHRYRGRRNRVLRDRRPCMVRLYSVRSLNDLGDAPANALRSDPAIRISVMIAGEIYIAIWSDGQRAVNDGLVSATVRCDGVAGDISRLQIAGCDTFQQQNRALIERRTHAASGLRISPTMTRGLVCPSFRDSDGGQFVQFDRCCGFAPRNRGTGAKKNDAEDGRGRPDDGMAPRDALVVP